MDKDTRSKKVPGQSQVIELSRQNASSRIRNMAELGSMTPDELSARKILHPGMANKEVLNTFREIRTQLLRISGGRNFVVMVTSLTGKAGSSFIASNLGAVLALDKTKTALLIDCNLYDSSLNQLLDVEPDYGLTDYLAEEHLDINDIIYASGIPRLRVVPAGTHVEVGAEYFASERMSGFIKDLKDRYPDRYIIMDVPPIGLEAEARILAELSDFTVLVVPYGKVTEAQVEAAVDAIGEEKLAGMIFNN
ncbi:MAG: polysaccharide biosynthesis protein [Pseudomonadota bacterium]|nr:polysaccharide biosynthesis protein [Pseudomonadales bacterium]MDY6918972.1 polysaccharide biosynthesis protein [Pseudomonadota bacterium]